MERYPKDLKLFDYEFHLLVSLVFGNNTELVVTYLLQMHIL